MKLHCACLFLILLFVLAACGLSDPAFEPSEGQIERNNRGVALMGQYRNEEARAVFADLLAEQPDWVDVEVNLAIAILNRQEEGDEYQALRIVEGVLENHAEHHRARYVAGLMRLYTGDTQAALYHLSQLANAAPDDAYVAYFTGQAYSQLGQVSEALAEYQRAIELDPYLRSAYYGAALAHRQLGNTEAARDMLGVYQRFEGNPRARLAEFVYTRKGVLAEAEAVSRSAEIEGQWRFDGRLFDSPLRLADVPLPDGVSSLTVADINASGNLDLLITGGQGQGNLVLLGQDGQFELSPDHPLTNIENVQAALWADMDNSGELELLLCRTGANQLLRVDGGLWTEAAGARDLADQNACIDGVVFDADHDGDLDILVINADAPAELFNNNLDESWRALSLDPQAGFEPGDRPGRQALAVDLDADRDADLVLIFDRPPHQVLRNDRLWQYQPFEGFEDFLVVDIQAVTSADFDATGQVELVTLDSAGLVHRWRPDADGHWRALELTRIDQAPVLRPALASLDLNGDGRPELLVQHAAGFHVFSIAEDGSVEQLHHEQADILALSPVLLDPARGPALAVVLEEETGPALWLWPAGQGRGQFTALAPTGMTDPGDGMRSNASGIGTGVLLRAGSRWSLADTYPNHSAPGQSLQPLAMGLGARDRADFVQLFWSDGVLQTEMDLAAGEVHRIPELQRQLASCPVLFAWNGERHEFVSDLLGVAGIGFFQAPGRYSEPRPWEYFKFPAGTIATRDGYYELKIAEPMEEIAYIDSARLQVYDLPPGWAMTLDERMFTGGGPEPTGKPVFYQPDQLLRPARASNDRGEDVTDQVLEADFRAAPPGPLDRRFLGRLAEDHVLTLEFDQVINPPGRRPVLIAYGWVEYPYSQTLFAAWQAGAKYRPPSLEAWSEGRWQPVYQHFGYPAGMPRHMSLPLDDLPPETTRLRISGNWEVYWDKLAVAWAEDRPEAVVAHDIGIDHARLARTGFARRDTLDQRLPYYDYSDRSPFWDTKHPTGRYTDFGPVEPLVAEANGAFAIFGPGEELHLAFAAPPTSPESYRRVVVLEVRGYAKDMDLYTRDGETVEPLPPPTLAGEEQIRQALHDQYLNRVQGAH